MRLTDSVVANNVAGAASTGAGGCFESMASDVELNRVVVANCEAYMGGCAHLQRGEARIRNSTFTDCRAEVQGGALAVTSAGNATIEQSNFSACSTVARTSVNCLTLTFYDEGQDLVPTHVNISDHATGEIVFRGSPTDYITTSTEELCLTVGGEYDVAMTTVDGYGFSWVLEGVTSSSALHYVVYKEEYARVETNYLDVLRGTGNFTVPYPSASDFTCAEAGGGAFFLSEGSMVSVWDSSIANSSASEGYGGAFFVSAQSPEIHSTLNLEDCKVGFSQADYYGAAFYNLLSTVTTTNTWIDPTSSSALGVAYNFGGEFDCRSMCPAGWFGDCETVGACASCTLDACSACAAGTYNPSPGALYSSACLACPEGSFAPDNGTITCAASCPAGSYLTDSASDTDGFGVTSAATHCLACPAGTFSFAANSTSCSHCAAGYFSESGATECTACPAGTFADDAGTATCTNCPNGKFADSNASISCDTCSGLGVTSEEGAAVCEKCVATFIWTGSECQACASGMVYDRTGTTLTNLEVEPRFWRETNQTDDVMSCPRGAASCRGGVGSGDALCAEGSTGPYCDVCEVDYYREALSSPCVNCPDSSTEAWTSISVTVQIVLVVLLALLAYHSWQAAKRRGWLHIGSPKQPVDRQAFVIEMMNKHTVSFEPPDEPNPPFPALREPSGGGLAASLEGAACVVEETNIDVEETERVVEEAKDDARDQSLRLGSSGSASEEGSGGPDAIDEAIIAQDAAVVANAVASTAVVAHDSAAIGLDSPSDSQVDPEDPVADQPDAGDGPHEEGPDATQFDGGLELDEPAALGGETDLGGDMVFAADMGDGFFDLRDVALEPVETFVQKFLNILRSLRGKAKILLQTLQIVGSWEHSFYNIKFPRLFSSFLDKMAAFTALDVFLVFPTLDMCSLNTRSSLFYYKLVFLTVGPILVCLALGIIYEVISIMNAHNLERQRTLHNQIATVFFFYTFTIFVSSSAVVFQTFDVDTELKDAGGGCFLRQDYGTRCDTSLYRGMVIYSSIMLFVFPVGIPLLYFIVLYKHRNLIDPPLKDGSKSRDPNSRAFAMQLRLRESNPAIAKFHFLFDSYEPRFWWFESYECIRRLVLTSVAMLISPGSTRQIFFSLCCGLLSVHIFSGTRPYTDDRTDFLAEVSQWMIVCSLLTIICIDLGEIVSSELANTLLSCFGITTFAIFTIDFMLELGEHVLEVTAVRREAFWDHHLADRFERFCANPCGRAFLGCYAAGAACLMCGARALGLCRASAADENGEQHGAMDRTSAMSFRTLPGVLGQISSMDEFERDKVQDELLGAMDDKEKERVHHKLAQELGHTHEHEHPLKPHELLAKLGPAEKEELVSLLWKQQTATATEEPDGESTDEPLDEPLWDWRLPSTSSSPSPKALLKIDSLPVPPLPLEPDHENGQSTIIFGPSSFAASLPTTMGVQNRAAPTGRSRSPRPLARGRQRHIVHAAL